MSMGIEGVTNLEMAVIFSVSLYIALCTPSMTSKVEETFVHLIVIGDAQNTRNSSTEVDGQLSGKLRLSEQL